LVVFIGKAQKVLLGGAAASLPHGGPVLLLGGAISHSHIQLFLVPSAVTLFPHWNQIFFAILAEQLFEFFSDFERNFDEVVELEPAELLELDRPLRLDVADRPR